MSKQQALLVLSFVVLPMTAQAQEIEAAEADVSFDGFPSAMFTFDPEVHTSAADEVAFDVLVNDVEHRIDLGVGADTLVAGETYTVAFSRFAMKHPTHPDADDLDVVTELDPWDVVPYLQTPDGGASFCGDRKVMAQAELIGTWGAQTITTGISGAFSAPLVMGLDACAISVAFCRDRECEWVPAIIPGSIAGRCRIAFWFEIEWLGEHCGCHLNADRGRRPPK